MGKERIKRVWFNRLGLILVYYMVAAATYAGIFSKWTFRDGDPTTSLISELDGTANRPFVYRQLLPAVANAINAVIPDRLKPALTPSKNLQLTFARAVDAEKPRYEFRYHLVFGLSFLCLFFSLFALRSICRELIGAGIAATITPPIFSLCLPYFMALGDYYYDTSELLFLSVAARICITRLAYALPLLALIATYNKESFLFFIPTLYPLLRIRHSKVGSGLVVLLGVIGAIAINLAVKYEFRRNPGSVIQFHLLENIKAYVNPRTYFQHEVTYSVIGPANLSVITIAVLAAVSALGWKAMPESLKRHTYLAALINVPLFLLFCAPGELRNLSFLYVSLTCLICCALNARAEPCKVS